MFLYDRTAKTLCKKLEIIKLENCHVNTFLLQCEDFLMSHTPTYTL